MELTLEYPDKIVICKAFKKNGYFYVPKNTLPGGKFPNGNEIMNNEQGIFKASYVSDNYKRELFTVVIVLLLAIILLLVVKKPLNKMDSSENMIINDF